MKLIRQEVFVRRLSQLLSFLKLSKRQAAIITGVSMGQFYKYFDGAKPRYKTLCKICERLGVSKAYLLGYEDYALSEFTAVRRTDCKPNYHSKGQNPRRY